MWLSRGQILGIVGAASLVVHIGLAGAIQAIPPIPRAKNVSIAVRAYEKPKPRKKDEPLPPPKVEAAKISTPKPSTPKPAPRDTPAPTAPVAAAAAPAVDFGLSLGNGGGPGGVAVPAGPAVAAAPTATGTASVAPTAKVLGAGPGDACTEAATKPRPLKVLQPAYTDAAREASIEGKVRVELSLDETGAVVGAKVVQGLGHGLDEAALAAAKGSSFAPATRCGKPVAATFVIGMRFSL